MKERIGYLDAAKALAILLVILGHCPMDELGMCGKYLHRLIYSFHMPLFFIISGMFFRTAETRAIVGEKFRAYCLPYLIVGGIVSVVEFFKMGDGWRIFYGTQGLPARLVSFSSIPGCGPLWFLWALFWGIVILNVIFMHVRKENRVALILIVATLGALSARLVRMPFSIQAGCLAVPYLYAGYEMREHGIVALFCQSRALVGWFAVCWLSSIVLDGTFEFGSLLLGGPITFLVTFIAPVVVLCGCKFCGLKGGWIGRSTLAIFCAHVMVDDCVFRNFGNPFVHLTASPLVNLAIVFVGELVCALCLAVVVQKVFVWLAFVHNR